MWKKVARLGHMNPLLSELCQQLPASITAAREKNTVKAYLSHWTRWLQWTTNMNLTPLPASEESIAIYLVYLGQSSPSSTTITNAFYAINWAHISAGFISPTERPWLKLCLEGVKRQTCKPRHKKEPLTPEIIHKLVATFASDTSSLLDLRDVTMCVLSYCGFLRFSELVNLRAHDISFQDMYFKLFIEKSKTDIYRDGSWLVIAKTNSLSCPYNLLKRYIDMARIQDNSEEFLFRPGVLLKKKSIYALRKNPSKAISYGRARELILDKLASLGLNKKSFGWHSCRAGGASAAANAGIRDRLFKRHGRWKSETAKDGYIKDDINALLSVSLQLGI